MSNLNFNICVDPRDALAALRELAKRGVIPRTRSELGAICIKLAGRPQGGEGKGKGEGKSKGEEEGSESGLRNLTKAQALEILEDQLPKLGRRIDRLDKLGL